MISKINAIAKPPAQIAVKGVSCSNGVLSIAIIPL